MNEEKFGYCHASCCCGETKLDTFKEYEWHTAQLVLDKNGYPSGYFGDDDIIEAMIEYNHEMNNNPLIAAAPDLYNVLHELEESVDYWSEYDVPIGIQDRIKNVLKKARGGV